MQSIGSLLVVHYEHYVTTYR